ncbi:MAG TPA: type II toxin-antitoxin system VapC family toxin [Nitrospirae bacterium]|nr:type II toxin-antitoxin system VapC family toxin [Nitrospirota bacterium]HDZ02889.1 type II toxin-antitoxin system VapC family toxin [Nitrospirota bacterium]
MRLVIDTNVFIYAFTTTTNPSCKSVINLIAESPDKFKLRIPRTIIEEVRRNMIPESFQEFFGFISEITSIDEDFFVPFEIAFRYERGGLKTADAFIAAYAEWVGADILVTENRHFLKHNPELPFKVLTADNCLKFNNKM